MSQYDLIVIGSGPGGYEAAHKAGSLGKKVLLIERDALGGVCTNWGCIPTKSLLHSGKLYDHALNSQSKGVITSDVSFDLTAAMTWKQETIATLQKGIAYLMKSAHVEVLFGEATGNRDGSVTVDGQTYTADAVIIATGSSSAMIPIEGVQLDHVVTSTGILSIDQLPTHLAVIGGGVIGVEFAALFSMLGVTVSVIEMTDEIIPMADKEIAKLLRREMKRVDFHLSSRVVNIDEKQVYFIGKDGSENSVEADLVLMSTGRVPNTELAEQMGVFIDRRAVVVNEVLKTNIPNVYAIGDVNGKSLLAHSASRMAEVAVNNLYGDGSQRMHYDAIPWAVYTQPEVAGCGLSESEARARGYNVQSATQQMRSNGRFLAENGKKASGLCKVVADGDTRVILGIQMIGPYASEMIHAAAVIIESELRVDEIAEVVFPHPSVSEVLKETILSLR